MVLHDYVERMMGFIGRVRFKELSVLGKRARLPMRTNPVSLKTTNSGVFEWLQTLDVGGAISIFVRFLTRRQGYLSVLCRAFSFGGNEIFESKPEDRVFLCSFSSNGSLLASNILATENMEWPIGLKLFRWIGPTVLPSEVVEQPTSLDKLG